MTSKTGDVRPLRRVLMEALAIFLGVGAALAARRLSASPIFENLVDLTIARYANVRGRTEQVTAPTASLRSSVSASWPRFSDKALLLARNNREGTSHSPSVRAPLRTCGPRSRMPRR